MIQQIIEYKNILSELSLLIDKSPYKKGYIIKKIGISSPTFYRKLKAGTFTADETLKIIRIISPEETYLHDLKQSIQRGKNDFKQGKTFNRSEVIKDIKELLI